MGRRVAGVAVSWRAVPAEGGWLAVLEGLIIGSVGVGVVLVAGDKVDVVVAIRADAVSKIKISCVSDGMSEGVISTALVPERAGVPISLFWPGTAVSAGAEALVV